MGHPAFNEIGHRPWPTPDRAWTWRQRWCDLLFAHWPVPVGAIRHLVPDSLEIQEFDGTSWLGLVPFRMEGVMRRPLPDVPGISAFPELNVRLYVEAEGRPGVWFLSLDASNPLAVWAARRFFHLSYYWARMSVKPAGDRLLYDSVRRMDGATFRGSYGPTGEAYRAKKGTLEHWLTERYCLYSRSPRGRIIRTDVHHVPWPLQPAEAEIRENTMLEPLNLSLAPDAPLLHFAREIDVVVWPGEVVGAE